MAQENNEDRKKIRLQKTSTARLKVVKANRPVVNGTTPDETVISEPEESAEGTAATSAEQAAAGADQQAAATADGPKESTDSTVRPSQPPTSKTNTVQLKVVQQKKKELDDRIKAHSTVKLRTPLKPSDEPEVPPNTETKSLGEGGKTVKITSPEAKATADETMSAPPTQATGTGDQPKTDEGAKKTLKIKRPGSDRTVKLGGAKSDATARIPSPAHTAEHRGVQGLAGTEAAMVDAKAEPGILYTLGAVVTLAACATMLFFLATQYMTHFSQ